MEGVSADEVKDILQDWRDKKLKKNNSALEFYCLNKLYTIKKKWETIEYFGSPSVLPCVCPYMKVS